jgi:hypothetical protein
MSLSNARSLGEDLRLTPSDQLCKKVSLFTRPSRSLLAPFGRTCRTRVPDIMVLPHFTCSTFAPVVRKEKQKEHMFSSGAFS